jgi:ApaG protein
VPGGDGRRPFYYQQTHGIRVTVRPAYLRDQSRPHAGQFVFAYHVRIENVGASAAQLLARRWLITDSSGDVTEVEGEGVVASSRRSTRGGCTSTAASACSSRRAGTWRGSTGFARPDGTRFDAEIPRFDLVVPPEPGGAA